MWKNQMAQSPREHASAVRDAISASNMQSIADVSGKPSSAGRNLSPVEEKLTYLSDEIGMLHAQMDKLENQLQPISYAVPKPALGTEPEAGEGCELESRLDAMYQRVRRLNARIKDLRNELRI